MKSLDEVLVGVKTVAISGHVRPDGDCVGSTLAVYNYIETYYPEIEIDLYLEDIPKTFLFLKNSDKIITEYGQDKAHDVFFSLDCGDLGRMEERAKYFHSATKTVCVDHHLNNSIPATESYNNPKASATCELVFELMNPEKITKEIAECLYVGMVHDTGVFQYDCTSAKTMNIAGVLMEKGIDYSKIVDETFYTKSFAQNKALGRALLDSELYLDGKLIISVITRAYMDEYQLSPKQLDGIVNQLRVTKGVYVACFLYENADGSLKGSFRCNNDVNVAEIAAVFGGGGHKKAAGFTIDGPQETAIAAIIKEVERKL